MAHGCTAWALIDFGRIDDGVELWKERLEIVGGDEAAEFQGVFRAERVESVAGLLFFSFNIIYSHTKGWAASDRSLFPGIRTHFELFHGFCSLRDLRLRPVTH